jgi:hypothetical protein
MGKPIFSSKSKVLDKVDVILDIETMLEVCDKEFLMAVYAKICGKELKYVGKNKFKISE